MHSHETCTSYAQTHFHPLLHTVTKKQAALGASYVPH